MVHSIWEAILPSPTEAIRLTVVVPTYNEADNLPQMAAALFALPIDGLQLLVVDDNSPDGTGDVADQLADAYNGEDGDGRPRMVVLHRTGQGRAGHGLRRRHEPGAGRRRRFCRADGCRLQPFARLHPAHARRDALHRMPMSWSAAAMCRAVRWTRAGALWRRFVSWWANLYSRIILGLRIRDMTAGFKLWQRDALLGIGLENVRSNGYSFQVEMAYLCEKLGYRIIEIPIHFADRRIGQSKLDMPVKLESAWRTWQIRWRYRRLARGFSAGDACVQSAVLIDEGQPTTVAPPNAAAQPHSSVIDH
jgi:dolichol-phosphate mannosyltransferase